MGGGQGTSLRTRTHPIPHHDASQTASPLIPEWFKAAHQSARDTRLFINDFHMLVGDFTQHKEAYEAIIEHLLANATPPDGIGFQGHFHGKKLTRTLEQLLTTLDRFDRFNLPLVLTEYDTLGKGWGDTREAQQAAEADW